MGEIAVTTRSGQTYQLAIEPGVSLMQSIRDAGINEVLALCGGCCACGTCHVYVDPAFEQFLPPIGSDEKGLLDYADHRRNESRLACQIPLSENLSGMSVRIAPEE